jgi:hypothetical protein
MTYFRPIAVAVCLLLFLAWTTPCSSLCLDKNGVPIPCSTITHQAQITCDNCCPGGVFDRCGAFADPCDPYRCPIWFTLCDYWLPWTECYSSGPCCVGTMWLPYYTVLCVSPDKDEGVCFCAEVGQPFWCSMPCCI